MGPASAVDRLGAAVLVKLGGTTLALVAVWKGGLLIALFIMGAAPGQPLHLGARSADGSMSTACLMVAMRVGVTKTPLGSTPAVTEAALLALPPVTLIAAVASMVVAGSITVIETQRAGGDSGPV